jgi:hypothetical protein
LILLIYISTFKKSGAKQLNPPLSTFKKSGAKQLNPPLSTFSTFEKSGAKLFSTFPRLEKAKQNYFLLFHVWKKWISS